MSVERKKKYGCYIFHVNITGLISLLEIELIRYVSNLVCETVLEI